MQQLPLTPYEDVRMRLGRPLKCGYVNCGQVWGTVGTDPESVRAFEEAQVLHKREAGHLRRKLDYDN